MSDQAHIIVVGNEKGGSGKSTVTMHVTVALLRAGFSVGTLDLDNRQWTLTRYLANRSATAKRGRSNLPLPAHFYLPRSTQPDRAAAEAEEMQGLERVMESFLPVHDFMVIDCPGTDSFLGRLAHSHADTLLTPLNDSFIDLDLFAFVDGATLEIKRPSIYSEMVWEARKEKAARGGKPIDWVVTRNRLTAIHSRNKEDMADVMTRLANRIGFRVAPGLSERVIYRELFLKGLTLLDLFEGPTSIQPRMSHVAARQEIRALMNALGLPGWTDGKIT